MIVLATNASICAHYFDINPFLNHQRVSRLRHAKEAIRDQRSCAACVGCSWVRCARGGVHVLVLGGGDGAETSQSGLLLCVSSAR